MNRREIIVGAAALAGCSQAGSQPERGDLIPPPFPMRRGVNLGNALEAPNEGDWGYRIEDNHLTAIAQAGFDGVRLPVRWDAHAIQATPYTISPAFFARIDEVVAMAIAAGLKVQLDLHHYDALVSAGASHRARFLALWAQIADRYNNIPPDLLMFEPFNEPNGDFWRGETLVQLQNDVVSVIRERDRARPIVLGPPNWQNIDALGDWRWRLGENLHASVHYYEPHAFTHQAAEWLGADAPSFGRTWGTAGDHSQVQRHIERAARWAYDHGCAMQLGEFGVNKALPIQQRAMWTRAVREACEANGLGWCVWDFAGAFPVWDRESGALIPLMRDALFA